MVEADDQNLCLLFQSEEGQGQINVETELLVFYANCPWNCCIQCAATSCQDEQQHHKLGKIFLKMMLVQGRCGCKTWLHTLLFIRKLRNT